LRFGGKNTHAEDIHKFHQPQFNQNPKKISKKREYGLEPCVEIPKKTTIKNNINYT